MLDIQSIRSAQASWGAGVVAIGAIADWAEAKTTAEQFIRDHYSLDSDTLLFCPTKAAVVQFRSTLKSVRSYFVGGDTEHPEDTGFALEPWSGVRFENADIVFKGDVAMAMGNYFFAKVDGSELKVEYSFVYFLDTGNKVKIQLHHSALPYGGQPG
jgi:hypothetical protein